MTTTRFLYALLEGIFSNIYNNYTDNIDFDRFGKKECTIVQKPYSVVDSYKLIEQLKLYEMYLKDFEFLYDLLNDFQSKDLLIKIILFRMLGNERIKLPLSTSLYWQGREKIRSFENKTDCIPIEFMNWSLCRFDLNQISFPIEIYSIVPRLHTCFIVKQYEYRSDSVNIELDDGDVVIDAGGCWGDTALYFANKVGANGMVYTCEFVPGNIGILEKNMDLNQNLSKRIELIRNPLWDKSGDILYYSDNGPGSTVNSQKMPEQDLSVLTVSIDDLVEKKNLNKVNFIKMDIEGAELNALKGAINTIIKFKPKLAISIYHKLSDFKTIPAFLSSLNIPYDFYLGHYSIHSEETVLYATLKV